MSDKILTDKYVIAIKNAESKYQYLYVTQQTDVIVGYFTPDFDKATLFNSKYEAINYLNSEIPSLQVNNLSNYNLYIARVALVFKFGKQI